MLYWEFKNVIAMNMLFERLNCALIITIKQCLRTQVAEMLFSKYFLVDTLITKWRCYLDKVVLQVEWNRS